MVIPSGLGKQTAAQRFCGGWWLQWHFSVGGAAVVLAEHASDDVTGWPLVDWYFDTLLTVSSVLPAPVNVDSLQLWQPAQELQVEPFASQLLVAQLELKVKPLSVPRWKWDHA